MEEPPVARPLRVLVVDADERVRESLAGLLRIGGRCIVVGTASQPADALALVAESTPDVVIVDPRLPEIDGGKAFLRHLRQTAPSVRVLVMGWSDSLEDDSMAAVADAFVRKTFRAHELLDAVMSAGGTIA